MDQIDTSLIANFQPLQLFRQGEQDQLAQNQRNLLREVGGHAATGNYIKAAQSAFEGGDLETGMGMQKWRNALQDRSRSLENATMDKRLKAIEFFERAANRADTPEKWNAYVDFGASVFGPQEAERWRPFEMRMPALEDINKTKTELARLRLQELQIANETRELSRPKFMQMPNGQVVRLPDDESGPAVDVTPDGYMPKGAEPEIMAVERDKRVLRIPKSGGPAEDVTPDIPPGQVESPIGPYKDMKQKADVEEGLRKEVFQTNKDYSTIRDSSAKIEAIAKQPSAASDMALVFSFMKILDPTSVVRETEYANAQNAAGVPDRIQNIWNKVLAGEFLTPTQRADFIAQAQTLAKTQSAQYERNLRQYQAVAERLGVDSRNVILDHDMLQPTAPPFPSAGATIPAPQPDPSNVPRWVAPGKPVDPNRPVKVQPQPRQQSAPQVPVLSPEEAATKPPGFVFRTLDGRVMKVPGG